MTITLSHSFISAKAQGADATLVSKNEWNAAHTLTQATGAILARTSASAGVTEEIVPDTTDFTMAALTLKQGPGRFTVLTTDFTGVDNSAAQPVFGTLQDAFTAEASTTYLFDAFYHIVRSAGTSAHTTGVLFGGTATLTSIRYSVQVSNPTGNVLSAVNSIVGVAATETVITGSNNSATENLIINLNGVIRVNAAGTIIPQFKYNTSPGGAPDVKADSYFRLRKIGTNTVTLGGAWA